MFYNLKMVSPIWVVYNVKVANPAKGIHSFRMISAV